MWSYDDARDADAVRRLFPETEVVTKLIDGRIKLSFSDGSILIVKGDNKFPSALPEVAYHKDEITC